MKTRQCMWQSNVITLTLLCLSGFFFMAGQAFGVGEDYPNKPIIINVGSAPGASAGNSAVIYADGMTKYLPHAQVLVNYKPGATTALAADYVQKQPADGYNLYLLDINLCTKLAARDGAKLPFTLDDFIHLGPIVYTPYLIPYNREKAKAKTIEDLIAYAKKHPGDISYGSSGIGSAIHLIAEIFQMKTGTQLTQIPFESSASNMAALLGGHIDTMFTTPGTVISQTRPGGGLGVLALMTAERWHQLPDVPTLIEKGIDIDRSYWTALTVRKGTPQAIVNMLRTAVKKAQEDPTVKEKVVKMGYGIPKWGWEEHAKKAKEEFELAREIFKKAGI